MVCVNYKQPTLSLWKWEQNLASMTLGAEKQREGGLIIWDGTRKRNSSMGTDCQEVCLFLLCSSFRVMSGLKTSIEARNMPWQPCFCQASVFSWLELTLVLTPPNWTERGQGGAHVSLIPRKNESKIIDSAVWFNLIINHHSLSADFEWLLGCSFLLQYAFILG